MTVEHGQVVVNGIARELALSAEASLLDVLRDQLGLRGAKPACGEGACGACTVLLDGRATRSCVTPAREAAGHSVTTIEGLADGVGLQPLQSAFADGGAMQCGYCISGMLMAATALLSESPSPTREEVRSALAGNVCRCCVYGGIERAILGVGTTAAGAADASDRAGAPVPRSAEFWSFRPRAPWDRIPASSREYFELLGDGLVLVLGPNPAGPPIPPGVDVEADRAWLHVGGDGQVTAFTGKMNMGQDNRTALSMLVAEELCVSPASVALAMADTDLCPFDVGTFGSRSLPDAGRALRAAAASARALLMSEAAARLGVAAGAVQASDGSVRCGDRAIGYGELVRGMGNMVATGSWDVQLTDPARWRFAGHPVPPVNARELVTGAQRFPSDIVAPEMLHGRVLRAPAYGATLRSADTAPARGFAGVTVVHEGDFVAVAAADPHLAERALAAIEARWTLSEAPGERDLVEHLRSHPVEMLGWQGARHREEGDVESALAAAEVRLDATYTTSYIAHTALEPRVALAAWEDGRLTVFTGTQQPFYVRYELAAALGVPEEDVRVIVPDTGGGFGGKHTEAEAIAAARLARAAGRPVRVALSREEEFRFTYMRPAAVIDVRSGALRDGAVVAWDFQNINSGSAGLEPPYRTGALRVSFQPADSPLPQGAYRTLAATANHFARESHIDELAHALGIDPLELRLSNVTDERLAAVLRAAADRASWGTATADAAHPTGLGIAAGLEKEGRVATCAQVRVIDEELEILRIVTAYDCGTVVNPATVESQIEGALVMGLGGALFEEVHFDSGRVLNASLRSYRVPRFGDVPPIEIVLIDRPEIPSAGAGETPIVAIAPAIANAIFAATGVRLRSLPLLRDGRLAR